MYFHKIIKEIKENYKDFAKNHEDVNSNSFYIDKWKTLFNQKTLRLFFSKKVLFVEGMTEYLFFNNILRRESQEELKDTEIIPIFGKYHYIYFYELAKKLNLNYWFLLDTDLDSYEVNYLKENNSAKLEELRKIFNFLDWK